MYRQVKTNYIMSFVLNTLPESIVGIFLSQNLTNESEVDQIYRTNPVLKYSKIPLKAPLLPLPYGQSQSSREYAYKSLAVADGKRQAQADTYTTIRTVP